MKSSLPGFINEQVTRRYRLSGAEHDRVVLPAAATCYIMATPLLVFNFWGFPLKHMSRQKRPLSEVQVKLSDRVSVSFVSA